MMEYKGYKAQIDFDNEAGVFHGEAINTRDSIVFCGRSVDELRSAFECAVEEYLEQNNQYIQDADKPLSGKIGVRLSPELQRRVVNAAQRANVSLNQWIVDCLEAAVDR